MNNKNMQYAVAAALVATLALAGCKKKDEPVPPVVVEPAPAPSVAPAPAPAPTVAVTTLDLGNAVGPDMKVAAPMTSFGKNDTIFAAVATSTSDPLATVPGKLSAKWSYQDGQVVNDESKDINFTGNGGTTFQVAKPGGWPAGSYKVDIMLDGNIVQTKQFLVK